LEELEERWLWILSTFLFKVIVEQHLFHVNNELINRAISHGTVIKSKLLAIVHEPHKKVILSSLPYLKDKVGSIRNVLLIEWWLEDCQEIRHVGVVS
jgi:hypothetical protein